MDFSSRKMLFTVSLSRLVVVLCLVVYGHDCFICPSGCECKGNFMECNLLESNGILHQELPNGTEHVKLYNWGCINLTWRQVTHLELFDTRFYCSQPILQLYNLISLKIHTVDFYKHFEILDEQAKLGVKELHFIGIKRLSFIDITRILNGTRFQGIEVLVVDRISSSNDSPTLTIDSTFFVMLSWKPDLRRLELIHLNLNVMDILSSKCPPKLNHLSLKGTIINKVKTYYDSDATHVCQSLRTLDISDTVFKPVRIFFIGLALLNNKLITGDDIKLYLFEYFFNVENILINNFNDYHIVLRGVMFDCSLYRAKFKRVYLSNNQIQIINGTYVSNNESGIEEYDISKNILEYISPHFLQPARFLKKFSLESNYLHVMQVEHPGDFAELVQNYLNLEQLDMSNNGLTGIPRDMFTQNTRLVHIYLGHNKLTSIDFRLSKCVDLEYVGLNDNIILITGFDDIKPLRSVLSLASQRNIAYIETGTRNVTSYKSRSSGVKFNLTGNSFACTCENLNFQLWMKENNGAFDDQSTQTYLCIYNGMDYNILTNEITDVSYDCHHQRRIRIALVFTGVGLVAILVMCLVTFLVRRHLRHRQQLRKLLRHLQNEDLPLQYLIFLSHCSADDELVLKYVLPSLSQTIQSITKKEREYICHADKHFRPGHTIVEEVMRSIEQSTVVVLVISNKYIKSPWCDMEAKEAATQQKPVILILTETIDTLDMSPVLKQIFNRYARFKCFVNEKGEYEVTPTWETLTSSVLDLASLQINV